MMDLAEIEAYVRSRVGAVFSEEHADKIALMLRQYAGSLVGPGPEKPTGPGPPASDQPTGPSD